MNSKPQLMVSRKDAGDMITHFYDKGRFHILMAGGRGFEETERSFKKWSIDVKEFLLAAFTTSEIADTFVASSPELSLADATDDEKRQNLVEGAVVPKTDYLHDLKATLAIYDTPAEPKATEFQIIHRICSRLPAVVRQLRHRHDDRETLDVSDEYDVQDLLHALLRLFFDDVRPEEHSPSYAGGASRIDFLLKKEQILVEIKMARPNLKARELGEQLIIDIARYKEHPDCKLLYCFVYDPNTYIKNPNGIENDLTRSDPFPVKVLIEPK